MASFEPVQSFFQAASERGQVAAIQAINFAIERDVDLHDQLRGLAGRVIAMAFDLPGPLQGKTLRLTLAADGLLAESSVPDVQPDVTLQITPDFFTGAVEQFFSPLPSGPSLKGVRIQGDAAVAEQLGPLIAVIRSRTSPVVDAITSHPAAFLAKRAVDYAIHDAKLVVTKTEFQSHVQDLRTLRDAIDRLEKKLQAASA